MPRHEITSQWSVELEEGYLRKVDAGDVLLWRPEARRTVYAAVFNTGNTEAEEAIERMLEGRGGGEPARTYDRVEPGIVGHAYLLPEGQGRHEYWGLNTWTAARGSVACVTFYFDTLDDLRWALDAWMSVQCGPPEKRYAN
jgi:hypothetical protein